MPSNKITELGILDYLKKSSIYKNPSIIYGIGDDAAVIKIDKERYLLATCDMLIEDRHFKRTDRLFDVGYKAVSCSLSDIAAMGGDPKFALASLGLPQRLNFSDIRSLYRGMKKAADRFCTEIVGGDTNSSDKLSIDISMMGFVHPEKLVLRSGAKIGDYIFVTGNLGGSIYKRHLTFIPRVREAQLLVKRYRLNSMIDISDGLVLDLSRILEASSVGAVIFENLIPVHRDARNLEEALYMGEDFELLFTLPESCAHKLLNDICRNRMGFSLSFIGRIVDDKSKIYLIDRSSKRYKMLKPKGFLHLFR